MGESYFDTENASRIILLYPHIPSLDSWNRGQRLTDYCTLQGHASQAPLPAILGSLRGSAPQRGSRGLAPWPQRSAQTALARREGESFREREGTHRNAWLPPSL